MAEISKPHSKKASRHLEFLAAILRPRKRFLRAGFLFSFGLHYIRAAKSKHTRIMSEPMDIRALSALIAEQQPFVSALTDGMRRTIVGQDKLVRSLLIGLLSDGHILLEGVPGLAKTLAIRTLAALVDSKFSRIQFTPDLLPADVVGTLIYSQRAESFSTKKGPIFANFVLADEINRAPAKVQSALLEAMQEHCVTIGDETFALPEPFLVLATQNPIEQEGTYPLPEAQTDRFMLKVVVGYPTLEEEKQIVRAHLQPDYSEEVSAVVSKEDVLRVREVVKKVYLDERIEQYIADLVFATREPERYNLGDMKPYLQYGGSPRASINMALAGRALAFLKGRGYVIPEDIRDVAFDVLRHRIGLTYEAEAENVESEAIISAVLNKVQVP